MFTLIVGLIISLIIIYLLNSLFWGSDIQKLKEEMDEINEEIRALEVQNSNLELRATLETRKKELQQKAKNLKINLN